MLANINIIDIINIASNILLGMSLVGTCLAILIFIIVKLFEFPFLKSVLWKICILFMITWIIFICCNVYILITTPTISDKQAVTYFNNKTLNYIV